MKCGIEIQKIHLINNYKTNIKSKGIYYKQTKADGKLRKKQSTYPILCQKNDSISSSIDLESQVLEALSVIIDPDLGENIVECGFIKDLNINSGEGDVSFRLELTTPACPIKDQFKRQSEEVVMKLDWVNKVKVSLDAIKNTNEDNRLTGLKKVTNIIAVYSCKGGVGKSTVSVNLAYTLMQMGAKVGIFDADVYGPSLPTMVNPKIKVLEMDSETLLLKPIEYEGVKLVSFGYAGQGSAIMRGPMVSGLIQQLLTQTNWGELDYLIIDFPPGTGDIQLTLCQTVALSGAVIVTTPQKLSFLDVAKGIRMFARLSVPCISIVENMSYFIADNKYYYPFGKGSGERIQKDFGISKLIKFPIISDLSSSSDDGIPLVIREPISETSKLFTELGVVVVQELAKLFKKDKNSVNYNEKLKAFVIRIGQEEMLIEPIVVRKNDTSAKSIDEWTRTNVKLDEMNVNDLEPESISLLGNYAIQILWKDGYNQVATFELLKSLPRINNNDISLI